MGLLSKLFGPRVAVTEIDVPASLAAADDPHIQIVDCRTQREWNSGHIDGATSIPLGSIGNHLTELDKDRPVIVVCRSGHRSTIAARRLMAAGFVDVRSMKGGIDAWNRSGNPLVS